MTIRVLQVVPAMSCGGIENLIMNIYRNIDRTQVQFDFMYHFSAPSFFDAEIEALGGHIYRMHVRDDYNLPCYLKALNVFFKEHPEYAVLHGHYSGFGMFYNAIAKKNGIQVRIGHSHNTMEESSFVGMIDKLMSRFFRYGVTDCMACSVAAGRYLFGKKEFTVRPNSIDTAQFTFSAQIRSAIRAQLNLPADAPVYGHVGRFEQQKNHLFLIDTFAEILKKQPNASLLLVGDGTLKQACVEKCNMLGITQAVHFLGVRSDTADLYSAMDVFLFPSLFEGFGIVALEAQANGLPCLISAGLPSEVCVTDLVTVLPLKSGAARWAEKAVTIHAGSMRESYASKVAHAGYDIKQDAAQLQSFYLQQAQLHPRKESL
ncbi:MAG: glycosyltransferase family 1 protein [Ruthenibacterium sp.]